MPGVSITRKSSAPFRLPFTESYMIPWNLTTFMNFENADTVTHMLVGGLSAAIVGAGDAVAKHEGGS